MGFLSNTTIDTLWDLETELGLHAHLMVAKPENHIVKWIDSGELPSFFTEHLKAS